VHVISLLPILQRTLTDIVDVLAALATISSKIAIAIGTAVASPLPPSKLTITNLQLQKKAIHLHISRKTFLYASNP